MRDAPAALISYLLSKKPCFTADLFTFTLLDNSTHYWTSSDQSIVSNGRTFLNTGPAITRGQWSVKNTIEIPSMDIHLISNGADFGSLNIKLAFQQGLFDGAYIQLERIYMPTIGDTSLGTVVLFGGRVSSSKTGARGVTITVKGLNQIMTQNIPRNVYRLGCIHTVYDSGCGLIPANFTTGQTVGAGSTQIVLNWGSGPPARASDYALGYVTMTSGAASGEKRSIFQSSAEGLQLVYPLYAFPAPGDTFTITKGCDLSSRMCSDVFANLANFRGFPFIPPAEVGV